MPTTGSVPTGHLRAAMHTDLLHRMLVARHYAERHIPVPIPGFEGLDLGIDPGEEAVVVGLSAALAPADTLVRSMSAGDAPGRHTAGPGSLYVCLCDVAETGGLPVLFFPAPAAASAEPFAIGTIEPIDGLDVEAVLAGACRAAQAARSDSRTRLMELDVSGRSDPIEILSVRMRAAHELDDNALRAIDDDAIRLVRAHLTA